MAPLLNTTEKKTLVIDQVATLKAKILLIFKSATLDLSDANSLFLIQLNQATQLASIYLSGLYLSVYELRKYICNERAEIVAMYVPSERLIAVVESCPSFHKILNGSVPPTAFTKAQPSSAP